MKRGSRKSESAVGNAAALGPFCVLVIVLSLFSTTTRADEPVTNKQGSMKAARKPVKLPGMVVDYFEKRCVDLEGTI